MPASKKKSRRPRKAPSKSKAGKPSLVQVKVWLATVLTPLVRALSVEASYAGRGRWSFRAGPQDFEFLCPTERMVAEVYIPNLLQYRRQYPYMAKRCDAHDATLDRLRTACREAFNALMQSSEFRALAPRPETEAQQWDLKYLAEYVVNGVRDLPQNYAFHDFWIHNGPKFLSLREHPSLVDRFSELNAAGRTFTTAVNELLEAAVAHQQTLADEYKLPPVDPLGTATV